MRKVKTTTTRVKKTTITLTGDDILKMLRMEYHVPKYASVTFHVPGGGDWSNEVLGLDDETPVFVEWTEEITETTEE